MSDDEINALTEFTKLNEQSNGELKTSMESMGWEFNEDPIIESELATKDNFNSASMSFARDLYKTAKRLDLNF